MSHFTLCIINSLISLLIKFQPRRTVFFLFICFGSNRDANECEHNKCIFFSAGRTRKTNAQWWEKKGTLYHAMPYAMWNNQSISNEKFILSPHWAGSNTICNCWYMIIIIIFSWYNGLSEAEQENILTEVTIWIMVW